MKNHDLSLQSYKFSLKHRFVHWNIGLFENMRRFSMNKYVLQWKIMICSQKSWFFMNSYDFKAMNFQWKIKCFHPTSSFSMTSENVSVNLFKMIAVFSLIVGFAFEYSDYGRVLRCLLFFTPIPNNFPSTHF